MLSARASGVRVIRSPVLFDMTVSGYPPSSTATTGVPQAIDSSGVIPNGSYQGVVIKISAAA